MEREIRKLKKLVKESRGSLSFTLSESSHPTDVENFIRHDHRKAYIVSQAETYVELGHPQVPSAVLLLQSRKDSVVNNGLVTIAGYDIGQLGKGRYSFAQVLLVYGRTLKQEHLTRMRSLLGAAGDLDGCMVRLMGEKIWVRVSADAVRKGFSFGIWARHLFQTIRKEVPSVESIEAIFVTGRDREVNETVLLAKSVNEKRREKLIRRMRQKSGDNYECDNPYDCNACPDKPECDVLK